MTNLTHNRALLFMHVAALLFGLTGVFGKLASTTPDAIVLGRALFAVVALVLFAQQLQRAEQAEARVGSLEKQLVEAEFQILAQKAQMASVRVAVDDLASRIAVLQGVVSEAQPTSP